MKSFIIAALLMFATSAWAEEYWAREFMPLPNQVITFNGIGDDNTVVSFTTIYYARENVRSEPDYWVSEYVIFPGDSDDPQFVPSVSVDYFINDQGLWVRTPYEKSMGQEPGLLLPYKFVKGGSFIGHHGVGYTIANVGIKVEEREHTYEDCMELTSEDGDQFYLMPEVGLVLSRGYNEQWMVKRQKLSIQKIREMLRQ